VIGWPVAPAAFEGLLCIGAIAAQEFLKERCIFTRSFQPIGACGGIKVRRGRVEKNCIGGGKGRNDTPCQSTVWMAAVVGKPLSSAPSGGCQNFQGPKLSKQGSCPEFPAFFRFLPLIRFVILVICGFGASVVLFQAQTTIGKGYVSSHLSAGCGSKKTFQCSAKIFEKTSFGIRALFLECFLTPRAFKRKRPDL